MKSTLRNSYLTLFRRATVFALLLISGSPTYTQTILSRVDRSGKVSYETHPPGVVITSIVQRDSILATYTLDLNEEVGVIVQFKAPPLARIKGEEKIIPLAKLTSALAQIEEVHRTFKQDILRVEREVLSQPNTVFKAANTRVRFEYKTAFNGVALRTRRWLVEEIKKLPYVESVYDDKEVKTLDDESNHIIGADSVWLRLGVTGKGIVIGIIDTGVDYLHPALGGGLGPNFKVVGGYDFVNDDPDPIDDNGHGTHVAGIAAANGVGLKGVAPDAKLMAFKVLDAGGSGYFSWIIGGIERALNPDGNPSTNDAVQVINLSLGGSGDPDDPLSQAVDNAAQSGVVCVVAAGNSGPGYQTIGSPGGARRALTVGATDKFDALASFSSRGPSNKIYAIKPDVVAPGVDINSAKRGGGDVRFSGTSMATPHVAGAAALLLELNPNWTPEVLKAALMESAKDLGGQTDIWSQGSGRINVYRAAKMGAVLTPGSVSFGLVDLSQSIWTRSDTLYLRNLSSAPKTFDLSIAGSFPAGISLRLSSNNLSVSPSQSAQIVFTISVNNALVPFPTTDPPAYTGKLVARSSTGTVAVPFAFIKSPVLQVTFDEEPWVVLVHDRWQRVYSFDVPGLYISLLLTAGKYDIMTAFKPSGRGVLRNVFKEGIDVNALNRLEVKKSQADRRINLITLDENGRIVDILDGIEHFFHRGSGIGYGFFGWFSREKFVSSFSTEYLWEWQARSHTPRNEYYTFNGYSVGCDTGITQQNDPENFKEVTYTYNLGPEISSVFPLIYLGRIASYEPEEPPLTRPFLQKFHYSPQPDSGFGIGPDPFFSPTTFNEIYLYNGAPFQTSASSLLMQTPFFRIVDRRTIEVEPIGFPSNKYLFTGDVFKAGLAPPHFRGKCSPSSNLIRLTFPVGYYYQMRDRAPHSGLFFRLFQEGSLIDSGNVHNRLSFGVPVIAGQYALEIPYDSYYVSEQRGRATVRFFFDTRLGDSSPPYLEGLNIFSDGKVSDFLSSSAENQLIFSVKDDAGLKSVGFFYRSANNTSWQSLSLTNQDDLYSAAIPGNLPNGFISLRIIAEDNSGNILDYKVEPGFRFGINRAPSAFNLRLPANRDTLRLTVPPKAISFTWQPSSDPDGDLLRYALRLSGPAVDSTIAGITDTTVQLNIMSRLRTASTYSWSVTVSDGIASVASPDTFTFRTSSTVTGVEELASNLPKEYALHQNYPNPFNPITTIRYELPRSSKVSLKVFDILGREVARLVDQAQPAGRHEVQWDARQTTGGLASGVASGVYFYRLSTDHSTLVRKMLLLR